MSSYPWQSAQWEYVVSRYRANTLPHALLLTGEAGLGKKDFAYQLAKLLLCESGDNCTGCASCQLLVAQNHPDLITLSLREKEKSIGVDTIRDILPQCYETPQRGKNKVILILATELLNHAACNALLKTLEEPEKNIYFILVCDKMYQLSKTLRSRCQVIRFYPGNFADNIAWLKTQTTTSSNIHAALYLTQGAPLLALDWLQSNQIENYLKIWNEAAALLTGKQDPLNIALIWQAHPLETVLHALHWLWVFALQNPSAEEDTALQTLAQFACRIRQTKSRYQLGLGYQTLLDLRRLLMQNTPFNLGMQLSALCIKLQREAAHAG